MWFAERRPLQVALLEDRVIIGGQASGAVVLKASPPSAQAAAWDAPLRALTPWLREHATPRTRLQLFLSVSYTHLTLPTIYSV